MSGSGPAGLGWTWLETRPYPEMLEFQELAVEARRTREIGDTVLLLEHPPTYTLGRRTGPGEIGNTKLHREAGIEICETPRGGGVTWHGPGQLIAYPIVDLRGIGAQPGGAARVDVAGFVAALEAAMAGTLAEWGVDATPIEGLTGIWTGDPGTIPERPEAEAVREGVSKGEIRKIGSIGLKVSRGITSHGMSLNLSCDLHPFERVTACGIEGCRVTSVRQETGHAPMTQEAGEVFAMALSSTLALAPLGPTTFTIPQSADLTPNP